MFERFTDRARRTVVLAQEEARLANSGAIGPEHILAGLIHEGEGVAAKVLADLGVTLDGVRHFAASTPGPAPGGHIPFTAECKKDLELSLREALQLGHNYIGTEHLLLALTRDPEGVTGVIFDELGVNPPAVREAVMKMLTEGRQPETRAISYTIDANTALPPGWTRTALPSDPIRELVDAANDIVEWFLGRDPASIEAREHLLRLKRAIDKVAAK